MSALDLEFLRAVIDVTKDEIVGMFTSRTLRKSRAERLVSLGFLERVHNLVQTRPDGGLYYSRQELTGYKMTQAGLTALAEAEAQAVTT